MSLRAKENRSFGGRFFGRIIRRANACASTQNHAKNFGRPQFLLLSLSFSLYLFSFTNEHEKVLCKTLCIVIDFKVIKVSRVAFHNSK